MKEIIFYFTIGIYMFAGWHHILLIVEMFILSWFARSYYRRHMDETRPEDEMVVTIMDHDTMTTDSLARGGAAPYGTLGNTTATQRNSLHRSNEPPLVLLNQPANNVGSRSTMTTTESKNHLQSGRDGRDEIVVDASNVAIELNKGYPGISSDA